MSAPSGYSKHEDIVFYLKEDGSVVIESGEAKIGVTSSQQLPEQEAHLIVMVNKKESMIPPGEMTNLNNTTPQTGDGNNDILLLIIASVTLVVILFFRRSKKREF